MHIATTNEGDLIKLFRQAIKDEQDRILELFRSIDTGGECYLDIAISDIKNILAEEDRQREARG